MTRHRSARAADTDILPGHLAGQGPPGEPEVLYPASQPPVSDIHLTRAADAQFEIIAVQVFCSHLPNPNPQSRRI